MPPTLYRFDFAGGTTTRLCGLAALDLPYPEHTGYDAWDREGRFYLASFAAVPTRTLSSPGSTRNVSAPAPAPNNLLAKRLLADSGPKVG
jgi:hypothetical protein